MSRKGIQVAIILCLVTLLLPVVGVSASEPARIDFLTFSSDKSPISGVVFEVVAISEPGKKEGTLLGTFTTGKDGTVTTGEIPYGLYIVRNTVIPEDYESIHDEDDVEISLPYVSEIGGELQYTILYQPKYREVIKVTEPTTTPISPDETEQVTKPVETSVKKSETDIDLDPDTDPPPTDDIGKNPNVYLIVGLALIVAATSLSIYFTAGRNKKSGSGE